ncbi:MAG: hypothetical protein WCG80_18290 [Spirochaetales bacterium]
MKKVALSFLALLAMGTFAFALDVAVASPLVVKVNASGSLIAGYDLDKGTFGLQNTTSGSVFINFIGDVNGATDTVEASTDKQGQISAEFRIGLNDGGATGSHVVAGSDITFDYAKIVLGDLYVKLAGVVDPSLDYSAPGNLFDGVLFNGTYGATTYSIGVADGVTTSAQTSTGGIEVGYTIPKTLGLIFQVANNQDWTAAASSTQTFEYAVTANVLAVEHATLGVAYLGSTVTNGVSGIGASVGYDAGIVSLLAQVDYHLSADGQYGAFITVAAPIIKGLSITSQTEYPNTGTLDEALKVSIAKDLLMVGSLDVGYQLTGSKIYADLELAPADGVTAFAKVSVNGSTDLNAKVGASLTKIFTNTTLSAEWDSSNLVNSKLGLVSVTATVSL